MIIVGAMTLMGTLQWAAYRVGHGKPKAVGLDDFDYLLEARDKTIRTARDMPKTK